MAQDAIKGEFRFDDLAGASASGRELVSLIESSGYPDTDCFALKLAIEEAVANAVKHGHKVGRKLVRVRYAITPDRVRIDVVDQGPGFDPAAVPDPTVDENRNKPNGRGVWLIYTYMDEVTYHPPGNHVTMIKHRSVTGDLG